MHKTVKLALGSILVACVVLALKTLAYLATGSVALFSDAVESIVNIAAACVAVFALKISAAPADENHPFGHTKAEYFAAVGEGVLIVAAAFLILGEAYASARNPTPLNLSVTGLALNAVATVLNTLWSWVLMRKGREWRSPALIADGRHLFGDVLTSLGILVGVGLVFLTGWQSLDALLAACVAVYMLWSGWRLIRDSVGGLMDEAVSPATMELIKNAIAAQADGAIEAHDVRTRYAGRRTFIEFHLIVPGDMKVSQAHIICDRIELALQREIAGSTVHIHVEPEHKAKPADAIVF
ncbi:MAG: cation diffusion facilitator family transporter [Rhodobacterales bacterium]